MRIVFIYAKAATPLQVYRLIKPSPAHDRRISTENQFVSRLRLAAVQDLVIRFQLSAVITFWTKNIASVDVVRWSIVTFSERGNAIVKSRNLTTLDGGWPLGPSMLANQCARE